MSHPKPTQQIFHQREPRFTPVAIDARFTHRSSKLGTVSGFPLRRTGLPCSMAIELNGRAVALIDFYMDSLGIPVRITIGETGETKTVGLGNGDYNWSRL